MNREKEWKGRGRREGRRRREGEREWQREDGVGADIADGDIERWREMENDGMKDDRRKWKDEAKYTCTSLLHQQTATVEPQTKGLSSWGPEGVGAAELG